MAAWRIGVMLRDHVQLKKGDKVGVKVNDDLVDYFLKPNFVIFKPSKEATTFLVKDAAKHYVQLEREATAKESEVLNEAWPIQREKLKKLWVRK